MKWIVGLEPGEGHESPLELAKWLDHAGFGRRGGSLVPVHVLPRLALMSSELEHLDLGAIECKARAALHAMASAHQTAGLLPEARIVEAIRIDEGLAKIAEEEGAQAIVVGRRKPRDKRVVVRLGPVARQLLRSLPVAVVITPPDLTEATSGDGPVIVATDFERHSEGAAVMGRRVASVLGRTLLVAHVEPAVSFVTRYAPPDAPAWLPRHAEELRAWATKHGIGDAALVSLRGDPVQQLGDLALAHRAAMIVTGARRLSATERLFNTSFSSELAATAWSPVAVVPG